jgi:hypothetical protein
MTTYSTPEQERLFEVVLAELARIGYQDGLLQRSYRFQDWFLPGNPERDADAAAFGEIPATYDSACFAVLVSNGKSGSELIRDYRSLGAPLALEVRPDRVLCWRVSSNPNAKPKPLIIRADEVGSAFRQNEALWRPESVLRAKNIGPVEPQQRDFIDLGLIPALEQHIRYKLDPLLRSILFGATVEYRERNGADPNPDELFRLLFRAIAGKVMHDRGVRRFDSVGGAPDADAILNAVATHYDDRQPVLRDPETRQTVISRLWKSFSFANLSVDVLAFIWENTLVDDDARKQLGIHATPPSVARYIVRQLPIHGIARWDRRVVEPCCGSGTFLLAALQRLRELVSPDLRSPAERHDYLKAMLSGFDVETFGLEVARHCLMLADFPNPNGWELVLEDVFTSPEQSPRFHAALSRAGIVLCNPPFGTFSPDDRVRYQLKSVYKPVELVGRVLDHLPARGLLGFVLPQQLLSGTHYRVIRERIAQRYDDIEVVSLPDEVFAEAEHETALLIAKRPRQGAGPLSVLHRKVEDGEWPAFSSTPTVVRQDHDWKSPAEASASFAVLDLQDVWDELKTFPTLENATGGRIHRGIEWNIPLTEENKQLLISRVEKPGYARGLASAPRGGFFSYQCPPVSYLCVKDEFKQYKAFDLPWREPKVVMNAKRKSRSRWRIAAFADYSGLVCYQTFTSLWPRAPWTATVLAAVLNGPVANAYVATREGTRDITTETLRGIPVPKLNKDLAEEIEALVAEYIAAVSHSGDARTAPQRTPDRILRMIDATVLRGYRLTPRMERGLLDYFNGHGERRPVPFWFSDYFPADFTPYFTLADYLSGSVPRSSASAWRSRRKAASKTVLDAMSAAADAFEE